MATTLISSRPQAAVAYAKLLPALEALGPHEVQEKKTCLHVVAGRSAFLGVHPRKDGLRLSVVLTRPVRGERVVKTEKLSANRYHNAIDFKADWDLDEDLQGWLAEAYARVTR